MQTITFHIPSMQCLHCVKKIETFVSEVEGVQEIQCQLESKSVQVSFISPATQEKIAEAIRECGFEIK